MFILNKKYHLKIKNFTVNFGPQHPAAHGVLKYFFNGYSTTIPVLVDPISTSLMIFKSKSAAGAVSSCPTPTAMYPDINIWNYVGSVVKGAVTDLTSAVLWKVILAACGIFLVGYSVVSIYNHAIEIYQIVQEYKQIVGNPQMVTLLDNQFAMLNNFNIKSAVLISKRTFGLLDVDACQLLVKFYIHSAQYSFHGILLDISNSNMI